MMPTLKKKYLRKGLYHLQPFFVRTFKHILSPLIGPKYEGPLNKARVLLASAMKMAFSTR